MQEQGVAATRQLAKRQFTWLRRETEAQWFYSEQMDIFQQALAYLMPLLHRNK